MKTNSNTKEPEPATRVINSRWHPLSRGMPPEWASACGEDEYGVWVKFRIDEVVQQMRWTAPGRFILGSPPEDEAGRFRLVPTLPRGNE